MTCPTSVIEETHTAEAEFDRIGKLLKRQLTFVDHHGHGLDQGQMAFSRSAECPKMCMHDVADFFFLI